MPRICHRSCLSIRAHSQTKLKEGMELNTELKNKVIEGYKCDMHRPIAVSGLMRSD